MRRAHACLAAGITALLCLGATHASAVVDAADAAGAVDAALELGREMYGDAGLSASGALSCATCHDPRNAHGPPRGSGAVMAGGRALDRAGRRAAPSLRYLDGTPQFALHFHVDRGREREDLGPAGGYMRDGRAASLALQPLLPLLDADEMANAGVQEAARRLRGAPYASRLAALDGGAPVDDAALLERAAACIAHYIQADRSFHPYSSRFDRYVAGEAGLDEAEQRGLAIFLDPARGNCAACHPATAPGGRRAGDFTDHSYHALGVPRNPSLAANRDRAHYDMGLCGPERHDLAARRELCGYFKTPTLRNVARRASYFHNGRYASLEEVLDFYFTRDTDPSRWYGPAARGGLPYDDLPRALRGNVERGEAPLDRRAGERPRVDAQGRRDLAAFLRTLDDADEVR